MKTEPFTSSALAVAAALAVLTLGVGWWAQNGS